MQFVATFIALTTRVCSYSALTSTRDREASVCRKDRLTILNVSSSVKHGGGCVMARACMAVSGTVSGAVYTTPFSLWNGVVLMCFALLFTQRSENDAFRKRGPERSVSETHRLAFSYKRLKPGWFENGWLAHAHYGCDGHSFPRMRKLMSSTRGFTSASYAFLVFLPFCNSALCAAAIQPHRQATQNLSHWPFCK